MHMLRRILGALILLLVSTTGVFAQEAEHFNGRPIAVDRGFARLGAGVYLEMEGTTNDAFEFQIRIDPTADVNWALPATQGSAGTQLQNNGDGGLSWGSAASTRDVKLLTGLLAPADALQAILSAPIHRFTYKPGAGTQDSTTEYAGIIADEAPWAMHFNGTVLNPVNTSGYAFAAIQAMQAEIDTLKAELAAKATKRSRWLFWRRK